MMNKKSIRCYKIFAHVAPNVYNYPVYFVTHEGSSNFSLATCINCGELFVVDLENPKTQRKTLQEIAGDQRCPNCNSALKATVRDYPGNIRLPNAELGHFTPDKLIPPDDESTIMEVFEILPR